MKDKITEFEQLFGDDLLSPSSQFENQLGRQLFGASEKQNSSRLFRVRTALAVGFATFAILASVFLMRPFSTSDSVLISSLYERAFASPLTETGSGAPTFWRSEITTTNGPAYALCNNTDGGTVGATDKTVSLFFRDGPITASLSKSDKWGLSQLYSEDPELPAFDVSHSAPLDSYYMSIDSSFLVDVNGSRLGPNTTLQRKDTGIYDIYAQFPGYGEGEVEMVPCKNIFVHIEVDAATNQAVRIRNYTSAAATEDTLIDTMSVVSETKSGSFDEIEPLFKAEGFDKEKADIYQNGSTYVTIKDISAGYSLTYPKGDLGKAKKETVENKDHQAVEYVFTFEKAPRLIYKVRTKYYNQSTDIPTVAALRKLAQVNNWTLEGDYDSPEVQIPGYGTVRTQTLQAITDKDRILVAETGSRDVPSVFATVPKTFEVQVVDPNVGSMASNFWNIGVRVFRPGTDPDGD